MFKVLYAPKRLYISLKLIVSEFRLRPKRSEFGVDVRSVLGDDFMSGFLRAATLIFSSNSINTTANLDQICDCLQRWLKPMDL